MTDPQTVTRRHPIRGALYGLSLGIGVAVYLVIFAIVPFSLVTSIIVLVICVILGILWGLYAPAKKPKGPPPAGIEPADAPASDLGLDADTGSRDTIVAEPGGFEPAPHEPPFGAPPDADPRRDT